MLNRIVYGQSPTASGPPAKIASLVIANSTSSVKNASFVLNASNDTKTKVFLVAADSAPKNGIARVTLQVPIFDRELAREVPFCTTYDPRPSEPGPLNVKPCTKDSEHQSQLFEFSTLDGTVRPIWQSAVSEASDIASEVPEFQRASVEAAAADFAIASSSNATTNSTSAASESNAAAPPRSVALLFAPEDPQAPKVASEDVAPNNGTAPSSLAAASTSLSNTSSKTSTDTASSPTALAQEARISSSSKSDSSPTQASTTSTSSAGASAAAVSSTSSTAASSSATGSPSPSKVLAAATTPTSSERVLDAAAPYEWMFTPGSH